MCDWPYTASRCRKKLCSSEMASLCPGMTLPRIKAYGIWYRRSKWWPSDRKWFPMRQHVVEVMGDFPVKMTRIKNSGRGEAEALPLPGSWARSIHTFLEFGLNNKGSTPRYICKISRGCWYLSSHPRGVLPERSNNTSLKPKTYHAYIYVIALVLCCFWRWSLGKFKGVKLHSGALPHWV